MRRALLVLFGVQAALIAVYHLVELARAPAAPFASEPLNAPAPPLRVEAQTGAIDLASFEDRAVIVHFWATWCLPCQDELPGLIAASRSAGVPLLAVTDEDWDTVVPYFDGAVPAEIVRDPSGGAVRSFGVSGLPETFVVRGARLHTRMGGARDWTSQGARDLLDSLGD